MEMKQLTKNGRTVEYGIDNGHVVVRDPATGKELRRIPLAAGEEDSPMQAQGFNEFRTCMRGCYPLRAGDPLLFAQCCAECATLVPT